MEKEKTFKLIEKWRATEKMYFPFPRYTAQDFITWLYKKGFTIETKFQGEDLEKQEELFK